MSFTSALPVAETQLGIALETVRGTPVTPAYWLPVMAPKYAPDIKYLPDKTLQGSMVDIYDEVPSLRMDTHGWDSYPYLDTLPVYLRACLGGVDHLTAASASTTLSAAATAGASSIETTAAVTAGTYLVLDQGTVGLQETVLVKTVTTATPYTATLAYPLVFSHAADATVAGLTSHTFSLLNNSDATGNQPPSCTISDYAGETNWRQLAGSQLDGFNLSGSADALPKLTCNWMAYLATTPTSMPLAAFSEAEAPPGWSATLAFNGVQVAGGGVGGASSGVLLDWGWDLKRNVKPIPAITGTQNYYQFFAGPVTASGKVTVIDDPSATWLTAYEEGVTETIDFTLTDIKAGYAVNYHSTRTKFIKGSLDRSNNEEWVTVPLELTLIPSATDALDGGVSPVVVTVANAQTTTY